LNTVDLNAFSALAARLVRPQGRLVAHLLSPAYGAGFAGRWLRVAQPSRRPRTIDVDIRGLRLSHALVSAEELYDRFLAGHFDRRQVYGLGLLVDGELESLLPDRVLDIVALLERNALSLPPLTSAGRFYVIDVERRRDR
jgi:hypothetical protein